jgi:hypothetical protein
MDEEYSRWGGAERSEKFLERARLRRALPILVKNFAFLQKAPSPMAHQKTNQPETDMIVILSRIPRSEPNGCQKMS